VSLRKPLSSPGAVLGQAPVLLPPARRKLRKRKKGRELKQRRLRKRRKRR
jgi:hypothetical protein